MRSGGFLGAFGEPAADDEGELATRLREPREGRGAPPSRPRGGGGELVTFVGSAVSKYDVDELDDLGRQPRREKFVEVRRPDGTVAKSRGERTFYGAFTGGFSAGYWNTVGSKEGWEPATFSSSRTKRERQSAMTVEDLMDEEDLRDHRASHRTLEARGDFATSSRSGGGGAAAGCGRGGGSGGGGGGALGPLPRGLREELFAPGEEPLGARLLRAGAPAAAAAASAAGAAEVDEAPPVAKKRYGCALPPPGFLAGASGGGGGGGGGAAEAAPADPDAGAESGGLVFDLRFFAGGASRRSDAAGADAAVVASSLAEDARRLEAQLERLWRGKSDLRGVGYGDGAGGGLAPARSRAPAARGGRLFLPSKRSLAAGRSQGYGEFGTGVFDMDEYDAWEDIYDSSTADKHAVYEPALKDDDVDDLARAAGALPDFDGAGSGGGGGRGFRAGPRSSGGGRRGSADGGPGDVGSGDVEGFVPASASDERPLDLRAWLPPRAPRGYRGWHVGDETAAEEARYGSREHRQLLDFLEKHGDRRLIDPSQRAALLGIRSRAPVSDAAAAGAPAGATAAAAASQLPAQQPASSSSSSAAAAPPPASSAAGAAEAATAPLWRGLDDAKKEQLLHSLGRSFVAGKEQDMDGGHAGRHQPFKSDPRKQARYARFCLAVEGKASAAEAWQETGGLSEADRSAELAEFGRVFRMFKQTHPDADVAAALDAPGALAAAGPVLRRTVLPWTPEKLLCKRWGVPEPAPSDAKEMRGAKRQREYAQQVQVGLAAISGTAHAAASGAAPRAAPAPAGQTSAGFSDFPPQPPMLGGAAAASPAVPAVGFSPELAAEPPRPPKTLFASIFGDSDDEG